MPDIPPFEMPDGALSATDQILPSILGYRGLDYAADSDLANSLSWSANGIEFADTSGETLYWGNGNLYVATTDKSRTTASLPYIRFRSWKFQKYGIWILASNGYDPVQVLKLSTGTFSNLGGIPPSAKHILIFGERLILANLDLAMGIGTTNTAVASSNFDYYISGAPYNKTAVVAGTALAAGTIPQNKYGLYRFTIDAAGTITCTPAAGNAAGYTTAAAAIAAIPAVPALNINMGYVTVMSTNAAGFVAGTDALMGGTGGNPATFTNYYIDTTYRSTKKIFWSGLADLEDWTSSVTTGCGYQDMPDLKGEITGLALLPNGFAIPSGYSIGTGWLSRGKDVFNFAVVEYDFGAIENTIISANHGIYFASDRDFRFFDGTSSKSIGLPVKLSILGAVGYAATQIPGTYKPASISTLREYSVAHDSEEKNVYWSYHWLSPNNSHVICYNYYLDQWTYFDGTGSTDTQLITCVYYSYANKCFALIKKDSAATEKFVKCMANTSGTSGYLTTREISLRGEDGEMKTIMITGIRPRISGYSTAIATTVYSRMNEDDTPLETTATIATSSFTGWGDLRATGRYHKIKTTLAGGTLKTIDVKYQVTGTK